MAEELERIFVIPLKNKNFKRTKSAPTAVKRVKKYLTKHMKVDKDKIWIDDSLNNHLWSHGKYRMPGKIRVKAVKFDDGIVEAYLPDIELKKSRRELLREEKEKKAPILRKEEVEETDEEGADDYEIAPAADGDVKIKKKKPKETEEKSKEEKGEEKKKEDKPKKTKDKKDKETKTTKKTQKTSKKSSSKTKKESKTTKKSGKSSSKSKKKSSSNKKKDTK